MHNIKIVLDSAANLTALDGVPFGVSPLKIVTDCKAYVDDDRLDPGAMATELRTYKGTSTTSCPNVDDWLEAFGEGHDILCITITSALSGTYNTARLAKASYEQAHPHYRVELIDSLSAGPEIALMAEKARELILAGHSLEEVAKGVRSYSTKLYFVLESLQNFANNGRVSKLAAKTVGILGIRVLGRADENGMLEVLGKVRGECNALSALVQMVTDAGYRGGKLRISHCDNAAGAEALSVLIREIYPHAEITVEACRGLCSYYAEQGGMLVGFETGEEV